MLWDVATTPLCNDMQDLPTFSTAIIFEIGEIDKTTRLVRACPSPVRAITADAEYQTVQAGVRAVSRETLQCKLEE